MLWYLLCVGGPCNQPYQSLGKINWLSKFTITWPHTVDVSHVCPGNSTPRSWTLCASTSQGFERGKLKLENAELFESQGEKTHLEKRKTQTLSAAFSRFLVSVSPLTTVYWIGRSNFSVGVYLQNTPLFKLNVCCFFSHTHTQPLNKCTIPLCGVQDLKLVAKHNIFECIS